MARNSLRREIEITFPCFCILSATSFCCFILTHSGCSIRCCQSRWPMSYDISVLCRPNGKKKSIYPIPLGESAQREKQIVLRPLYSLQIALVQHTVALLFSPCITLTCWKMQAICHICVRLFMRPYFLCHSTATTPWRWCSPASWALANTVRPTQIPTGPWKSWKCWMNSTRSSMLWPTPSETWTCTRWVSQPSAVAT